MWDFTFRALLVLFIFLSVPLAHGHNKVVVIPLGGDDAPPPTVYAIGDTGPGGGIVFHVTNGGLNGLEAAPVDQAPAPWNCLSTDVAGVDNILLAGTPDSQSGAANTVIVSITCGIGSAAAGAALYIWPNGQTDGFLPNKEELNLLFAQKSVVGGFALPNYWSSSEYNSNNAWLHNFVSDVKLEGDKFNTDGVRAVRAF